MSGSSPAVAPLPCPSREGGNPADQRGRAMVCCLPSGAAMTQSQTPRDGRPERKHPPGDGPTTTPIAVCRGMWMTPAQPPMATDAEATRMFRSLLAVWSRGRNPLSLSSELIERLLRGR